MSYWKELSGAKAREESAVFFDAIRPCALEKIEALLKHNPDLALSKDDEGNTPLHRAAY